MRTSPTRSATGMISLAWAMRAVGAVDAHQAFVEGDVAGLRRDHRLEGERDAPFVERGDDLVGRAHAFLRNASRSTFGR